MGYEEGDSRNGPQAARGLHQWHDCGPGQENPTHNKVNGWCVGSCLCVFCRMLHMVIKSKPVMTSKHGLCVILSGDCTMGVFNIKRRRFEFLSEYQSGDLTSVVLMKRGRKVVCGSSQGTLYVFNWNGFGATSDRFALKAESVECIVPVTDSIMCTASTDGYIRWVEQPTAGSTLVLPTGFLQECLNNVNILFLPLELSTSYQTG